MRRDRIGFGSFGAFWPKAAMKAKCVQPQPPGTEQRSQSLLQYVSRASSTGSFLRFAWGQESGRTLLSIYCP